MKSVHGCGNYIIHSIVSDFVVKDGMGETVAENRLRYIDGVIHQDGFNRLDGQLFENRTHAKGVCNVLEKRIKVIAKRKDLGQIAAQWEYRLMRSSCYS
jgi:hypothetical protein